LSWDASTDTGGSGMRDTNTYRVVITGTLSRDYYTANTTYTPTLDEGVFSWKLYSRDNAGNNSNYTANYTLTIDITAPTVTTVTVFDTEITDADAPGTATFEVTVDFDEAMDTGVAPTLVFNPGVAPTLTLNGGQSGWIDNDIYVAKYDVADASVDIDSVTIDATGAQDLAGNEQEDYTPVHEFEIDTENPTVGIVVSDQAIYDGNVDVDAFTVTATYSEAMDPGTIPTLTFTPDPAKTLTNRSGAWSGGNTVYTWTTDVEDAGMEIDDIDVAVFGGTDVAGNDQVSNTLTDHIDIDTLSPIITSITSTTPDGHYASGSINVTGSFSELVTLSGGTLDVTLDTPGDVVSLAAFGPATSSFATYTISAGDNSCDLDAIGVALSGGASLTDAAGNDAAVSLPGITIANGSDIVVDTTNPVITPIASGKTVECDGAGNVTELNTWLNSHGGANATDNCSWVTWSNDFTTLSDDCGETGSATVTFTATDACGNFSTTEATFTIQDTTNPVINDLVVDDHVLVSADCCETTVNFTANVTDNCCIVPDNVAVTVTLPTGNKDGSMLREVRMSAA
jgi:hypothetical protein